MSTSDVRASANAQPADINNVRKGITSFNANEMTGDQS
jgi:hypothetical protein